MSLTQCEILKTARIVRIHGGNCVKSKLTAMGLVPGMEIKVIRSHNRGPMIVEVMESRVMLGHGMASKIIVE